MLGFGAAPQGIGLEVQIQELRECSVRWGEVNRKLCCYVAGMLSRLSRKVKGKFLKNAAEESEVAAKLADLFLIGLTFVSVAGWSEA